jgi:hypothetical protein
VSWGGRSRCLGFAGLIVALLAIGAQGASAATLKANYQLQGNRASSVAGAPDLTDLGAGNAFAPDTVSGTSRQVLSFPMGSGLRLATTNSLISNSSYSAVMLFRLADVSGYRRLIEFKNGVSDIGVYVLDGKLDFYLRSGPTTFTDFGGANAVFAPNTYAEVAIVLGYDTGIGGNRLTGYVNGALQVSGAPDPFDDTLLPGGGGAGLNFFQDNTSGGATGEDSAGAVACIRAYDGTLTQADVNQIYDDQTCPTKPPATASRTKKCKKKAKKKAAASKKKRCKKKRKG